MKIQNIIKNRYVKQIALFTALVTPVVIAQIDYDKNVMKKSKNEIKAKDPQRYAMLEKRAEDGNMSKFRWKEECIKMNDSLRIDSVYKKAYFEGAQMVRDSIMNVK